MYQAFLEQGNYEFRKGKYLAAINSYSKAISRNPQLIEAHYGCGLAAERLQKHKLAQDCFTTVVKLQAKSPHDEVILQPPIELSLSDKSDNNLPQKNSSYSGIMLVLFLIAMTLRTYVLIGHITDLFNSQSIPQQNFESIESVRD